MANVSSANQEVTAGRKARLPIETMREKLEMDIAEGERRLKELAETRAIITARNAACKDSLNGVKGILAARTGLEKTFEYMAAES
jgi:hypothetical protein